MNRPTGAPSRRWIGGLVVAVLIVAAGFLAWSITTAAPDRIDGAAAAGSERPSDQTVAQSSEPAPESEPAVEATPSPTSAPGDAAESTSSEPTPSESAPSAPAELKDVTVAFVPKIIGVPYFEAMNAGGQAAATATPGLTWIYDGPVGADPAAQEIIVAGLINQGVDVLIVSPLDPEGIAPLLAQAVAAGIKVLTVDTDAPTSERQLFINQASVQGIGEGLTDALLSRIGPAGKYAIVSCGESAANLNAWIEVQKAYTAAQYPQAELLEVVYAGEELEQATAMAADLMAKYPQLTGLVGECTSSAPGIAQAVRDAGKIGAVTTVGLGTPQSMREYLLDGSSSAAVLWDVESLGYLAAWAGYQVGNDQPFGTTTAVSPLLPAVQYDEASEQLIMGPVMEFTADNVDNYDY